MSIKIENTIYDASELMAAFRAGNDAGNGFAVGDADMTPREAAEIDWTHRADLTPEGSVVATDFGRIYVVADVNGPWAVDVTDLLDED